MSLNVYDWLSLTEGSNLHNSKSFILLIESGQPTSLSLLLWEKKKKRQINGLDFYSAFNMKAVQIALQCFIFTHALIAEELLCKVLICGSLGFSGLAKDNQTC